MLPDILGFLPPAAMTTLPQASALSHVRWPVVPAADRSFERLPTFTEGTTPVKQRPSRVQWPTSHLALFRDVAVIGRGAVVNRQGRIVPDSVSHIGEAFIGNAAYHAKELSPFGIVARDGVVQRPAWLRNTPPLHLHEPVFHLLNGRDQNYTHFLFEVLPKLTIYRAMPEPRPKLLVSEPVAQNFAGLLQALGVAAEDLVVAPTKGWIIADEIYVAGSPYWINHDVMQALREAGRPPPGPGEDRIYIQRIGVKTWFRKLLNEEAVIQRLMARGFRCMVPEQMSAAEQLTQFQRAGAVAGLYGGGLLNAVFSAPGTRVLSLTSMAYWRSGLDTAAPILGLRAAQVVGPCFLARQDPNNSAFVIDLRALDAACDALDL